MLDVASPIATSNQDVSSSGGHANTVTTTPESTASTNVGGPVNQIPSSATNQYQLNPDSDSVADGTSGNLPSTTSASGPVMADNALETPPFPDVAQETSSSSDVAQGTSSSAGLAQGSSSSAGVTQGSPSSAGVAQGSSLFSEIAQETTSLPDLGSTNSGDFGAATQYGAFIGSDPLNPVSAFNDVFQNTGVNTLGSGGRNGAIPLTSGSIGTNFAGAASADRVVNTLESIIQNGASPTSGSIGTDRRAHV